MFDRYATPEMRALWAPQTRFGLWLEIELLAAEAQANLEIIPAAAAEQLRREARVGTPDRIAEIERTETQHDVVAFLRSVAEETGAVARFLHRGLGSSDVVDTAQSILLGRAAQLLDAALGLVPAPVSSQVLQRDRHAEFLCALAVLGGTLERIATDIRTLQRTEIREAEEPFRGGQTGSSAMPHKRNPILCERICGLARIVRGHALAAMENQALWGERDISHSSAERIALPQATTLIHYMTRLLADVVRGLRVYPEAMRRNLWRYGGIVFSHAVLLALLEKGLPRDEAYAAVQSVALEALDADGDFRALIAARGWLAPARLEQCFDLTPYLRHVPMIIDRVLVGEAAPDHQPVGGR